MEKHKVLDQLLDELQRFLKVLDGENLSGNATAQKGVLSDLLQSYRSSSGGDEEYIYMNKVHILRNQDICDRELTSLMETNGSPGKHVSAPQKSLPDLPTARTSVAGREPFPLPPVPAPAFLESPEGYYEEAQPYDLTLNEDAEAVSSSYESYDEEEMSKGKSAAQHQWPSTEASIELMKDARICAFLWRKKWLGQWTKQLCVIRENRLLCYKSSKDQTPLLDVSLVACSVIYKEKQPKRREHKLKIIPQGGEAIVLGLQSKEQTEQWLKVIQEISPKSTEGTEVSDSPRLICTKGELTERHSMASESGSSTDSHADLTDSKDVKKKHGPGLKFSNLMNIGKKKVSSLESPEKNIETSGYLNVLVNSQWRTRWCLVKNRQLWFYQDKGKGKVVQQPVALEGCMVLPDPSPEHLYSFRIQMAGEELATLEAKSSTDMGHWLGLLLSQTGTRTDPAELTYDYVNSERISSILNAARTSMYLMQRRFSEPNTYIDSPPSDPQGTDDIYDDVASIGNDQEEEDEESTGEVAVCVDQEQDDKTRVYLDLAPVRSFLHTSSGRGSPQTSQSQNRDPSTPPAPTEEWQDPKDQDTSPDQSQCDSTLSTGPKDLPDTPKVNCDPPPSPGLQTQRSSGSQEGLRKAPTSSPQSNPQSHLPTHTPQSPPTLRGRAPSTDRLKAPLTVSSGSIEVKLGKNRTEADVRRFTDERDRLEREREEVKSSLATLRKERREAKEELSSCQDPTQQASLEAYLKQKEEACREAEHRRVEVELRLVEVKESLRKVEAGPFTLGTTVDSGILDSPTPKTTSAAPVRPPSPSPVNNGETSPINCATALKSRPPSIMAPSKGNVLQKAKEWEKKGST
ncbi:actin filament-associated protein 1-like 2 [Chanos chanos]|uniref:Actin filament-associated protein 1-like 2 n=1 Tax=Chanos chanos TaxID=29144 RepID=A0A6J2VDX6_CHACN|nr:actin filament-associated protein 1-like 2 [Chanos chanos]